MSFDCLKSWSHCRYLYHPLLLRTIIHKPFRIKYSGLPLVTHPTGRFHDAPQKLYYNYIVPELWPSRFLCHAATDGELVV